jgi:hypothetical protein
VILRSLFLPAAVAAALYAGDFTGRVVAITDEDTIKVMNDGAAERIPIKTPQSRSSSNLRPSSMHFMQIFAVRPAPDRISCGVSFRQTLQNRSVRGSGSPFDAYPGQ